MEEKRELARKLLEEDSAQAVALLEECVTGGDAEAMVMLARCCALGRGVEHNPHRAEALISRAATLGNEEAVALMDIISNWKGLYIPHLRSL